MTESMVSAEDVKFSYNREEQILKGAGVEIRRGEILGVLGPNGSGKTTLMKCINRILEPSQGRILLMGDEVKSLNRRDIARRVGFVPQSSGGQGSSPMVYDVVMMGRRPHATWQFSENDEKVVWEIMESMDIAHLASHHFNELSSGQLQRVLIARALAQDAQILLLDEPTSNLDVKYQIDVMELISGIVSERKLGACAIVHDLDLAMKYCDRIALMSGGNMVASGNTDEVMTPENIREVFGISVVVEHSHGRNRVIMPRCSSVSTCSHNRFH